MGEEGVVALAPLAATRMELLLRGDSSSPMSVGLEAARWPVSFKMPDVKAYEGNTDPIEFLWAYETSIDLAGGDDTTKVMNITLAVIGMVLTWFFNIPPRSIYVSKQLRDQICNNFKGNYTEPKDVGNLFIIKLHWVSPCVSSSSGS